MANPTYNPFTRMDDTDAIPPNSLGTRRIRAWNIDDNLSMFALIWERMMIGFWAQGGIINAGTVNQSTNTISVSYRWGVTADLKAIVGIHSLGESYDFTGKADGYYTLVIKAQIADQAQTFIDADTGENISHMMVYEFGVLDVVYDASSYQAVPDNSVGVAQVRVISGAIDSYIEITTAASTYASPHASSHEVGGGDELEIALSQIPSINSEAATFLAAATLLAQQQALDLEPTVDIPSLSQFTALDNAAAKTADAESITGQWTFGNRVDLYASEPGFFLGEADGTYGAYFVFNNDILQVQQRLKNFTSAVSFMKWNFPIPANSFIMQSTTGYLGLGVATAAIAERIHAAGNCRISGAYKIDTNDVINSSRIFILRSYTVATLPSAVTGGQIYVSDETGGAVPAFSDGTNWRRVTDRAIVS